MQAFLRSYDEKELFLIQNFVKRLQTKAEKIKHINMNMNNNYSNVNNINAYNNNSYMNTNINRIKKLRT